MYSGAYRAVKEVLGHILVDFFPAFGWLTISAKAAIGRRPDGFETKPGAGGAKTRQGATKSTEGIVPIELTVERLAETKGAAGIIAVEVGIKTRDEF
jgi:hypothetical protein